MTENEERTKEWLNRNYGLALEISAMTRYLERMESNIEKVCKPLRMKEVQEEPSGNTQEERMAEYIDLSAELERKQMIMEAKDAETRRVIDQMDSAILRTILIERYMNRLRWKEMTEKLHFEQSRLFELHRQALDAVMPFVPKDERQ